MTPTEAPPPGWYVDSSAPGLQRWFDGERWTGHTRPTEGRHRGVPSPVEVALADRGPVATGSTDALHWVVPVGRRGTAIAAGYTAIVALVCWVLAPVSLGLGVWALRDLERHGGHGRGRAWFAVVVGAVGSVLVLLVLGGGVLSGW